MRTAIGICVVLCASCSSAALDDAGLSDASTVDLGPIPGGPCSPEGLEFCTPYYVDCLSGHWREFGHPCDSGVADLGSDAGGSTADGGDAGGVGVDAGPLTFVAENRMLTSSGVDRTFVLARPEPTAAGLPLVISLHPDGGDGPSFRSAMSLESVATRPMVFVYPSAPGGTFDYYEADGRTREAQFVRDLIAALASELAIDTTHVFVTGMSGGATMTNVLACYLGPAVIRGVGVHSGTLYQLSPPDFDVDPSNRPSCALPAAIFVWGELDMSDVSFTDGEDTRDKYRESQSCGSAADTPWTHDPCVAYAGCTQPIVWCPVAGLAHALWPGAAGVIQPFFESL